MILLSLRDVTVRKERGKILDRLNLKVKKGEIHAIIGTNGVGKTTLANVIMGLEKIAGGEIIFNQKNIANWDVTKRAKSGIRVLQQIPPSFEGIKIREYLKIGNNLSINEIKQFIKEVGLPEDYSERFLDDTLSGGERKRVEIASILTSKPQLAILDEPDSGIDMLSLQDIKRIIKKLNKEGATVILITHREDIAEAADTASLMCAGKILKTGTPKEINTIFKNKCKSCNHKNKPSKNGLHK